MKCRRRTSIAPNHVTLQRALSKLGFCSRSQATVVIQEGHVSVNGVICTNPQQWIDLVADTIKVDGAKVVRSPYRYVLFYKPVNIITTASDEHGRKTIYEVLPPEYRNLRPVGRLDKDTAGLLLLTNDTQLAETITNPDSHIEKVYEVETYEPLTRKHFQILRNGIEIRIDGKNYYVVPRKISVITPSKFLVTIDEGKNRQVRRMVHAIGATVKMLTRIAIGSLQLGAMNPGDYRELLRDDLLKAIGMNYIYSSGGMCAKYCK
ncbi:MAG: rRNA pseudouridine synthase [Bacteroidetes bacterium]|nr:rRNA pseudouridine synthase [Bacteroidota bacterium]